MRRTRVVHALLVAGAVVLLAAGQVLAIVGAGLADLAVLWIAAFVAVVLAAVEPTGEDVRVLPWVAAVAAVAPLLAALVEPGRVVAIAASGLPVWGGLELLALARAEARLTGALAPGAGQDALAAARRARLDDVTLLAAVAAPVAGAVVLASLVDVGGGLVLVALGGLAALAARAVLTRAGQAG